MKSTPLVLTVNETAKLLGISKAKVYLMIDMDLLEGIRLGRVWRVPVQSVEQMIGGIPEEYFA